MTKALSMMSGKDEKKEQPQVEVASSKDGGDGVVVGSDNAGGALSVFSRCLGDRHPRAQHGAQVVVNVVTVAALLYGFLFALDLMGTAFKVLGGRSAGDVFKGINNPLAGLMVGVLATVLLQSSSTTTSIVVSMVGSKLINVENAIPIIMGANIGTSITNSLVSLGHVRSVGEFKKAFAGATVHDFFNVLNVLVMLPFEVVTGFLHWITGLLTDALVGGSGSEWEGPLKKIVGPLVDLVIKVDKKKIKDIAKGKDVTGSLIKGGVFNDADMSDNAVGAICLAASLLILVVCLVLLVTFLKRILMTRAGHWLKRSLEVNALVSMCIGCAITILVQSSSVTTSAMVPLIAVGAIDLEHLFPLTLGANVGTTVTALLAALTQDSADALQIAFVHLLFNLIGIVMWYPTPFMRRLPLALARNLGEEVAKRRYLAVVYIAVVFGVIPLNLLGFSEGGEPWLLWFGLALNVLVLASVYGAVYLRRHRPDLIPCVVLRPDDYLGPQVKMASDLELGAGDDGDVASGDASTSEENHS